MPWQVYWITDDVTKDFKTYGYIGVTSRGSSKRLLQHINVSKNIRCKSYWRELYKAIRHYGDDIKLVTICDCSEEYAKDLERRLRPVENVGWNLAAGGFTPTTKLTKSEIKSRQIFSKICKQFIKDLKNSSAPWIYSRADWSDAQIAYENWIYDPCGVRALCTRMKVTRNKRFIKYIDLFENGWIPIQDIKWKELYGSSKCC